MIFKILKKILSTMLYINKLPFYSNKLGNYSAPSVLS